MTRHRHQGAWPWAAGVAAALLMLAWAWGAGAAATHHGPRFWRPLIDRLARSGMDRAWLERLFARPEVRFEKRIMAVKVVPSHHRPDYSKFLRKDRLQRAYRFLQDHYTLLERMERRYGVPKEVKVAVLLVETDFGRCLGTRRAFNVLASMARVRSTDQIRPLIPPEVRRDRARMRRLDRRLKDKSRWAFQELKALLRYCRENHLDPLAVRGSIFGAIGYCQFMPSNIYRFGQDGNGDGRIDLFDLEDALASMANYLRQAGWRQGLSRRQQERVILRYNHSRAYAHTVIEVARRLKEMERRESPHSASL